jgi:hypothetical protein
MSMAITIIQASPLPPTQIMTKKKNTQKNKNKRKVSKATIKT